jgi:hypothetical protein
MDEKILEHFATTGAERDSQESDPFAGKLAPTAIPMMVRLVGVLLTFMANTAIHASLTPSGNAKENRSKARCATLGAKKDTKAWGPSVGAPVKKDTKMMVQHAVNPFTFLDVSPMAVASGKSARNVSKQT